MSKSKKSILAWSLIVLGVLFLLAALGAPSDARVGGLFISGIFIAAGIYFKKKGATAKSQQIDIQSRQDSSSKKVTNAALKEKEIPENEKEEQAKKYIEANVVNSTSCTSRKYTNKDVAVEWLTQVLSDYYEGQLKWSQPNVFKYADVHAIIGDGCIVAIKGTPNNCLAKIHVPVDTSNIKLNVGGAISSAIGSMISDKILIGRSFGKISTAHAFKNAIADKERETRAIVLQGRQLEEQIASHIDECIKSRTSRPVTSADDVATQIKKLSDLKDSGILTNDEFESKKKDLLNRL